MARAKKFGWLKAGKNKMWGVLGGDWKKGKRYAKQHKQGLKTV